MVYECIATAAFGLEGVAARELRSLGFDDVRAENGGARFSADEAGILRANLWLGTADRVLIVLGEFPARSFDELFEGVRALPWENFMSPRGRILVKGKCVRSMLMSVRDCQSITKKAIVERLKDKLNVRVLPEDAEEYSLEVAVSKDVARLTLDTSGNALNKRGYRVLNGEAAIRETLARALLMLSPWRMDEPLYEILTTSLIQPYPVQRNWQQTGYKRILLATETAKAAFFMDIKKPPIFSTGGAMLRLESRYHF